MRYIYGLVCPVENKIMYVGAAVNPEDRLHKHLGLAHNGDTSIKGAWIRSLMALGESPSVEVLEECTEDTWREREDYWIEYHRALNPDMKNSHDCARPRSRSPRLDNVRLNFVASKDTERKLEKLAKSNTNGNASMFLRMLIDRAYAAPVKFGVNPPKKEGDK